MPTGACAITCARAARPFSRWRRSWPTRASADSATRRRSCRGTTTCCRRRCFRTARTGRGISRSSPRSRSLPPVRAMSRTWCCCAITTARPIPPAAMSAGFRSYPRRRISPRGRWAPPAARTPRSSIRTPARCACAIRSSRAPMAMWASCCSIWTPTRCSPRSAAGGSR